MNKDNSHPTSDGVADVHYLNVKKLTIAEIPNPPENDTVHVSELTDESNYLLQTLLMELRDTKTSLETKIDRQGTLINQLSIKVSTLSYELGQSRRANKAIIRRLDTLLGETPVNDYVSDQPNDNRPPDHHS